MKDWSRAAAVALLVIGLSFVSPTRASDEPAGRAGRGVGSVSDTPYRVVGLGDSVPAAWTLDARESYVSLVGAKMAADRGQYAEIDNLAIPGATSEDVLEHLSDPDARAALEQADLVIVTVGANDLDPDELGNQQDQDFSLRRAMGALGRIISDVRALAPSAKVVVTGYWNVFADGAVAEGLGAEYVAMSDRLTRQFNALVGELAAAEHVIYVDIYTPFKAVGDDTSLLSDDGEHPSQAGHAVIAEAIERALS